MLTNEVCELFLFQPDTWSFQDYLTEDLYKIVLNRQLWYQYVSCGTSLGHFDKAPKQTD